MFNKINDCKKNKLQCWQHPTEWLLTTNVNPGFIKTFLSLKDTSKVSNSSGFHKVSSFKKFQITYLVSSLIWKFKISNKWNLKQDVWFQLCIKPTGFLVVLLAETVNLLNELYLKAALVIQIFTSLSNFTYFELYNWLLSWLRVSSDASRKPLPGELGPIIVFILDAHNNQK